MKNILFVPIAVLFGICSLYSELADAQDRIVGENFATRSAIYATQGMASTSQPLATQIALDILKQGGSAVDAAIAANAALGLMEPTGCGIGGDLFAIVWDAETQQLHRLNGSGRSPKNLTFEYFLEHDYQYIPYLGPLTVSVPGCVDAWIELHKKFGTLELEVLLQPAIDYAQEGYPVTPYIAYGINAGVKSRSDFPGVEALFLPDGIELQAGDIRRNPQLAQSLGYIAKGGRDAFYSGRFAETIAAAVQEQGGFLSVEDLENHRSEWVQPVSTNYRGYDVWEIPPNGQGIAVLQMLNILEQFDLASMGYGSADYLHVLTEAKKLAYEDRAKYYADMDFSEVPVDELISKAYAQGRVDMLDMHKAAKAFPAGDIEQGNTIYLTVADSKGNMVSLIQSNYGGLGSGIVAGDLGFMLQNRGALFALEKGHANCYAPEKRPFHTIIPAFVTQEGQPWLSFGVMGGAMQPQGHVQILVNLIDFGMSLQEAGDAPRIRHMGSSQPTGEEMTRGGTLYLESGFDYDVISELMSRGHKISYRKGIYGSYHAILRKEGDQGYEGACESRYDGAAAGY